MKTFHNVKCKAYLHDRLNTSKGIIRSRELSLDTPKEIKTALGNQGCHRTIRSGGEDVETHTHTSILIFNKSVIPKEVKIGFYLKRV